MTSSLQARLLLGLIGVLVAGLLVLDAAIYLALEGRLVDRIDSQLDGGKFMALSALQDQQHHPGMGRPSGPTADLLAGLPAGTYTDLRGPGGSVIDHHTFTSRPDPGTQPAAQPAVEPAAAPVVPAAAIAGARTDALVHQTLPGSGGVSEYRVLIERLPPDGTEVLVVAIPLTDVQSTLGLLLLLEAAISASVLALMALLAWWIVRIGLRPLARMGATAQAIAAGDLGRRVEPATPRTEIGRLGLALNGMLSQIETAFEQRTRSEQRLRQFLADASHELRTPLTSIRGYAELLRRGADRSPEDAALARRRIEQESVRMSALVEDLLLLARLDQGRPLQQAPADLRAIAQDACADLRAVAPARTITLTAPEPVVVTGDEMRLRQVVGNLLRNALVHTPAGTPVEVAVSGSGGRATLTVADHGPGLPAEAAGRVFEPFYRADPGRSRDRGGSGLGLSIVAAVVAAHGGRVEARDTPGGGATFRVELRLAAPAPPGPAPFRPHRELTADSQPSLGEV